ncbi:hypothetical protein EAE96_006705 [Botrytis aclada]|nr:hypothetical protein EAE96_006705 [Botrytis aclada]
MSSSPTTSTETIVADPEGDVLLLLESEDIEQVDKTKILCSSKHLGLASAVFKAMLRPNVYNEGTTLSHFGKVEIPLPEDDAEIMTTLVLLIHGRHKHPGLLPMKTIDSLGQAAILVDKYQMHEATNFRTTEWARSYFREYPILSHRLSDLPLLLCITWVFNMEDEFRETTRQMQYKTVGSIIDSVASFPGGLPIPQSVIRRLEILRCSNIRRMFVPIRVIITTRQNYIDSSRRFCKATSKSETPENAYEVQQHRKRCDRLFLDSLISTASEKGLWPLDVAESLVNTSSVYRVLKMAEDLDFTTECERLVDLHTDHPAIKFEVDYNHMSKWMIVDVMRKTAEQLTGLELMREKKRFHVPMLETYR